MKKVVLLSSLLLLCSAKPEDKPRVYICTGQYSECYHSHSDCEGLITCSREIKCVTLDEAKKMKRRPCTYCYGNKK